MSELPQAARFYWFATMVAAGVTLVGAAVTLGPSMPRLQLHDWLSFAALLVVAIVGESMSIMLITFSHDSARHSLGSVAAVAAIIVLPISAAVLLIVIAMLWAERKTTLVKGLFNTAETTLAVLAAGMVFHLLESTPSELYAHDAGGALHALVAMLGLAVTYYLVNNGLVATMVALASSQRVRDVYHANHWNTVLQEATVIGLGLILGGLWLYNVAFAPFVALPVAMSYFSIETFVRIQQETRDAVLEMAKSIDLRDSATRLHSQRVAKLSVALARQIQLSNEQISNIELSALVHDIGKIGIPNEILNKPGKLTAEERSQMEAHPVIGYEMLRHYRQFRKGLGIVRWHHERWDGAGYPDRILGSDVPLEARIVSVADAFEAMTADRPYRKAMSIQVAFGRLMENSGTQFDPDLVGPFRAALVNCGEWHQDAESEEEAPAVAVPRAPLPPVSSPRTMVPPLSATIRPVRAGRVHPITRIPAQGACHAVAMRPARKIGT